MSLHSATILWQRNGLEFTNRTYSRAHTWSFDGGAVVAASASPNVVKPPLSDVFGVDPEEAFVASLSSCHMLWFLYLAAERRLIVDSYQDQAVGLLGRTTERKTAIVQVYLRPLIILEHGIEPHRETLLELHDEAHDRCFISNSVTSRISIEPRY